VLTLTRKPLAWFKPKPQVRTQFDDAEARRLGESMKVKQLQPVVAMPDGTLLVGERRLRGAGLAGLAELDVIVTDEPFTDDKVVCDQLTENIHRASLSDAETYRACKELLARHPEWKRKDLAARLHKDAGWVTRLLAVDDCEPAVREAFLAGELGLTHAYAIARSPDQAAALAAKRGGAGRDALERGARRAKAAPAAERATRLKIALASGLTVTFSGGAGLTLESAIEAALDAGKELKRGKAQGLTARTISRVSSERAKAGGGDEPVPAA
jgi:ParB family transcriptional regulator, chromosome partitioning protein